VGVERCQFWSAASRRAPCLCLSAVVRCVPALHTVRLPRDDDNCRLLRHGHTTPSVVTDSPCFSRALAELLVRLRRQHSLESDFSIVRPSHLPSCPYLESVCTCFGLAATTASLTSSRQYAGARNVSHPRARNAGRRDVAQLQLRSPQSVSGCTAAGHFLLRCCTVSLGLQQAMQC